MRDENLNFDAGAKFHVVNNTPYIRYFLAHILQFQFYQHLCQIANQNQPDKDLYRCNFEGNIDVGIELKKMLRRAFRRML